MPVKNKFAKYLKKSIKKKLRQLPKRVNRINRNLGNKSMVTMGLGFPKKIMVHHKYSEFITMAPAGAILSQYRFSCNSMNDPNVTGTGHRPMYYAQYAALYDHYCVIGSKIKIKIIPNSLSEEPICYGIFINDDNSTTPTTINELNENSLARTKYTAFGNAQPGTLTARWSAKKYFGGSVLANDELKAATGSNPAEQSYYNIYLQSVDLVSATSITVAVEIDYITIWRELKDIAGSS